MVAGIPEGISHISVPPRRERLLLRLHTHHVKGTLTRAAGMVGLRSTDSQIQGEQDVTLLSDDCLLHACDGACNTVCCHPVKQHQDYMLYGGGNQRHAQLMQEHRLLESPSASDASAAKAELGRQAGSQGIYIAKVPALTISYECNMDHAVSL